MGWGWHIVFKTVSVIKGKPTLGRVSRLKDNSEQYMTPDWIPYWRRENTVEDIIGTIDKNEIQMAEQIKDFFHA